MIHPIDPWIQARPRPVCSQCSFAIFDTWIPYCAKTQPKRNRLIDPNSNLEIHASAVADRKRLDGVLCYYEPVT